MEESKKNSVPTLKLALDILALNFNKVVLDLSNACLVGKLQSPWRKVQKGNYLDIKWPPFHMVKII